MDVITLFKYFLYFVFFSALLFLIFSFFKDAHEEAEEQNVTERPSFFKVIYNYLTSYLGAILGTIFLGLITYYFSTGNLSKWIWFS